MNLRSPGFTAGRWHRAATKEGETVAITADTGRICTLNQTLGGLNGVSERNANGRLIAAAPDLFYALQRIVEELPSRRDWLDPDLEKYARQVLSEAEGNP